MIDEDSILGRTITHHKHHSTTHMSLQNTFSDSEVKIGTTSASAAYVALDTIRERGILPPGFNINLQFADSKCSSVSTLESILEYWEGDERYFPVFFVTSSVLNDIRSML